MRPREIWDKDPIFIEIGLGDAVLADALRHEGYHKYLGVGNDAANIGRLQTEHPELASQLTHSNRRKLVLNNNAQVLVLSGTKMLHLWKYRYVRHAEWVVWPAGFALL
ncbi:MAG: hypothetical protein ACR2NU_12905, partial [Aeoliella sp.]